MQTNKHHASYHFVNDGVAVERKIIMLRLSLVVLLTSYINVSFGGDKEPVDMFDNRALQLENLWKAGQQREYFLRVAEIVESTVTDYKGASQNLIIAKLLEDVLSKEVIARQVDLKDLEVMRRLAWLLISNYNVSRDNCQTNAVLLCRYLGKIRNERIQGFEPKFVVANVAPPVGVPGMAGMDPKAIADPVARAEYEGAIRANQANNLLNSRQIALERASNEMSLVIMAYVTRTFYDASLPYDILRKCMNDAKFEDHEQKEVLAEIAKGIKK